MQPFVINIINNDKSGVFRVKSQTDIKAKVRYINFGVAKASLIIDGMIRYDCSKPAGVWNWMRRAQYNLEAPNNQYTTPFYKLKIRMEVKVKKFNWFKFNYECKKCEDLVNKSGTFGQSKASCSADMNRYWEYLDEVNRRCGRRQSDLECHEP